mgnify:FL=1
MNGHTKISSGQASPVEIPNDSDTLIDQIGSFLGASLGVFLIGMLILTITSIGV